MKNTTVKTNEMWNKFLDKFFNSHNYSTRRKAYNSAWAILLGLLVTIIIISFFGYNPFEVIISFFGDANISNIFIPTLVTFILSGLAVAICFKARIFNIGIAGQMMLAGFMTLILIRQDVAINGMASHSTIILSILLSIVTSVFASLIIAVLKAYLNINEVVTSIMLNWIIFFVIRYVVEMYQDTSSFHLTTSELFGYGKTTGYTEFIEIPGNYFIESWYKSGWSWTLILVTLAITLIIWTIIRFTKFGYKIKMVGISPTAADYSGTNKINLILATMTISGVLSGLAGFVWYFSVQQGVLDISISSGPLYVGFNAIAISLIVFDNPIAIILSSFIFSIISVGSQTATSYPIIPGEMTDIISGIFIYSAALAFVFNKFLPYQWTRNFIILLKYKEYRKLYWKNWKEYFVYHSSYFKEKKELMKHWMSNKCAWNNIRKEMKFKQKYELEQLIGTPKFSFKKLSNDDQIKYLDLLTRIKKETDILLNYEGYFDKYKIKGKRKERYQSWKQEYNKLKTKLLNKHLKVIKEKLEDSTNELLAKEKSMIEKNVKSKGGK